MPPETEKDYLQEAEKIFDKLMNMRNSVEELIAILREQTRKIEALTKNDESEEIESTKEAINTYHAIFTASFLQTCVQIVKAQEMYTINAHRGEQFAKAQAEKAGFVKAIEDLKVITQMKFIEFAKALKVRDSLILNSNNNEALKSLINRNQQLEAENRGYKERLDLLGQSKHPTVLFLQEQFKKCGRSSDGAADRNQQSEALGEQEHKNGNRISPMI